MGGPGAHKPNAGSPAFLSSRQSTPPPPSQQATQPLDNTVTEELGYTASTGKVEMVASGQKSGEMVTLLMTLDKKLFTEPDKLQLVAYHLRVSTVGQALRTDTSFLSIVDYKTPLSIVVSEFEEMHFL